MEFAIHAGHCSSMKHRRRVVKTVSFCLFGEADDGCDELACQRPKNGTETEGRNRELGGISTIIGQAAEDCFRTTQNCDPLILTSLDLSCDQRERVHRPGFQQGRLVSGYLQKVLLDENRSEIWKVTAQCITAGSNYTRQVLDIPNPVGQGRMPFGVLCSTPMKTGERAQIADRAALLNSTTVLLVGNIEPTMDWYKRLGFACKYYPPGFAILRRDEIEIFLQQQPGYSAPDDPLRREREAWNVYIVTDNVTALYEEYSALPEVEISRPLCTQEHGMLEFDVTDLNGYRLVFAQPIVAGPSS